MLGDSFRRLQADELDLEWDQLVQGKPRSDGESLNVVLSELNALIPAANGGAKSQIRNHLFPGRHTPAATAASARTIEFVSSPPPFERPSARSRWWSSPMAAVEALVACLVIAALALGISVYRSDGQGETPSFLAAMIEGTPESAIAPNYAPTPDYDIVFDAYAEMGGTSVAWHASVNAGKHVLLVRELYLPENVGFSYDFTGVSLLIAVNGTISVTSDSSPIATIDAGESTAQHTRTRIGIENAGDGAAMVFQAIVIEGTDFNAAWGNDPSMRGFTAYSRGYALADFPAGGISIAFEALDESVMSRDVADGGYEMFCSIVGPNTLLVVSGNVGIFSGGVEAPYSPILPGTTTIFGYGSGFFALPGSTYSLSTPGDSDVLGFSLRIDPEQIATPAATPG